MNRLRAWWGDRPRPTLGTITFAVLLLSMTSLSVISAVVFHSLNTQRVRTADQAISEYASLGARLFGDRAFGMFEGTRLRILASIYGARLRPGDPIPSFERFVEDATREMDQIRFVAGDTGRGFFALDMATGRWVAAGSATRPGMEARLRRILLEAPRPQDRRMEPMVWLLSDASDTLSVGYTALRTADGVTRAWYGFAYTRAAGWKSVGDAVMEGLPLLPRVFIATDFQYGLDPSSTDSLIAVRVLDARGAALYASRPEFAESPHGEFQFNTGVSTLHVETTLHPALVELLRTSLKGSHARVTWQWTDASGVPRFAVPLPLDVLLPIVAALLAIMAGIGLWRERQLTRARRDFVASVSHELRTPLSQIRLFTETLLLRREKDDEERIRWLGIVSRESRRLGDLVENILLFSHLDADRSRIEKERTDLGELIEEVVDGYVPVASQKGMRLVADAPSRIFGLVDPRAMRQVVVNLLDNALKYGPVGQVVTIELERVGDLARMVVSDQGPGIASEDREKIWKPFVRLGDVGMTGGSGIGLSVVRDLVRQHGGTIDVGDAPGGGARFVVELPVRDSSDGLPLRATGEFRAREVAAKRAAGPEVRGEA